MTNTLNPQARLMAETRTLVSKWEKTGLLAGLRNDIEKTNMAVLLEQFSNTEGGNAVPLTCLIKRQRTLAERL